MSIVITGDTHGTFDIGKVVRYFNEHEDEYTRDDCLIICGDVGICGFSAAYEANTRAVFRSLPVTTLFIDGNHENFEQLNSYAVEQWNGGKVHIIEDNMIHLMRGQIFDAYKFASDLIKSARQSLVLIDNYVDESVLLMLSKRQPGVTATIYTQRITPQFRLDLDRHKDQYPPVDVRTCKLSHDRFLIVDDAVYHIGASLKDLGKKWFAFSKLSLPAEMITNLL